MRAVVIVEGKKDRERILPLLREDIDVLCTFGIPTHQRVMEIHARVQNDELFVFTDSDDVGKRIRGMLAEEFPEAIHLHTKREYDGVEHTPPEFLFQLFEKHEIAKT
ncbi:hypothetical protein [Ferroacidibacillus organovorans]|uniref:Toprim domain-containing protein n=1 Tax=Ferroacidibacillus organovorans TaxID=1765683 RepID=A0A162T6A6_9BACL|nr:hypothetical protein [Ferroacidibacillus organovorans]KYP80506.1 hypothetical protein AYJ22_02375 [Ferroacidibacillus organovorans]OAG94734.1 hypothetical protein AYW79_04140 [Ferroacidibacillus organovorans]OPG16552.1 hypothetical protein B2M26_06685 [Ferroacidibacillus organovorans]